MNLAGQLEVLTNDEIQMVHEKACELLANKGVVFQSEKALETFKANGAKVEGQTVMIPKELVEKCVLDDEMISRVRFIINGMKTDEEQMGMKELMNCKPCRDFLMEESTCLHVRDGWQPTVSDWRSSDAWEADGSKDVVEAAHRKVQDIPEAAPESLLTEEQEKDLMKYINSVQ